jgi:hypothetical protein
MRAALILVGLGTLAVMELEASPRTAKPADAPVAPAPVGSSVSRDTLTTADRLEIFHVQHDAPAQPTSSIEPTSPPDQAAIVAQEASKILDQGKPGATAKKFTVVLPKPRPRQAAAKTTANRSRAIAGSCRPGAFDGLLKVLNLSSGCET